MALTLVTGRANTGKTGVLYRALREAVDVGRAVTLLLPTRPDVRRAEDELGRDGLVGARIAVLDAWVEGLWALHGDGRRIIGPGARRALLRQAIDSSDLGVLAPSAVAPGFGELLAGVAARLTSVPPSGTNVPHTGTPVDAEAGRIVRRYHELASAAGLVERAIVMRLVGEDPPQLEGPLLVNRFTDLSEAQEALLAGLAERNEVALALTWEPDLPATAALDPLVSRLMEHAEVVSQVAPPAVTELERLEERLYCPGEPIAAEGELEVGLAAGDEAECVLAVRSARRLVDEGTDPDRIAVVFRDVGSRVRLLTAAFAAEGLVADFDVAVPVSATSFGAAFAALIGSCVAPSRERLLSLLLSPYGGAGPAELAEADARWRRHRPSGERLLRDARRLSDATDAAIAAGGRAARGLEQANAAAWRAAADALFAAAWGQADPCPAAAELDAAAHRALVGVVDEVTSVPGGSLPAAEAVRIIAESATTAGAAERPGAVQVTEAHRLRSRRFDAVILGGLTAEEFSAERSQPLSSAIAERLGAAPGMQEREAERMLFYLVASRARRKLVLLRQESDSRGEAKRPSVFWDEVVDLYVEDGSTGESPQWPPGVEPERLGLAEVASAAPAYAPGRRTLREEASGRGAGRRPRGKLEHEEVLAALARTNEFAVTELETYLACPYRWFFERAVRPRELDVEVDARERGSRAHRLLTAFYERLGPELGLARILPERLDAALELFDRVAGLLEEAAVTHAVGLGEELAVAEAGEWARGIVRDDAELLPEFAPVRHEFAFGEAAGRPFALGGVPLRGSVDRIDSGPGGLVVTDYKSDRQPKGHGSFAKAGLIQLPVYAAAAEALLKDAVVAGLYRSLRSLSMRGFRLSEVDLGGRGSSSDEVGPEEVAALVDQASEAVARAAEGIRKGDIRQAPANKSACEWCGASAFCEEGR